MSESTDKARQAEATRILLRGRSAARGEREASRDLLAAMLDEELGELARAADRRERADHTVDSKAILQDLYLRLIDATKADWSDRARFLQIAARALRILLVEQARAHRAGGRGVAWRRVAVVPGLLHPPVPTVDLAVLGAALEKLSKRDARVASVVEMFLLAGLNVREIAYLLSVSEKTVDSDGAFARRWLGREIAAG
ncbi:MAG TPA: ECF-type sigma factor [Candidatus Eisenbacteria bacterium]|nr:ECF-type sigma factor [Candidatus Eisenbacteria bacterium]